MFLALLKRQTAPQPDPRRRHMPLSDADLEHVVGGLPRPYEAPRDLPYQDMLDALDAKASTANKP